MTPKEKAKELYDKYLPLVRISDLYDTYHNKAKQCALICVDEIQKQLNKMESKDLSDLQYWGEVEYEINKL